MASIEKREFISKRTGKKTTHWYVRYYEGRGANRKRKSLPGAFTKETHAKAARDRMLAERAAGTFGQPSKDALFRDVAEKWLALKEPELGVRTFIDYTQVVNNHILPVFGDRQISQIKPDEIVAFRNEKHKKVSPRTTNKILGVLKMVFAYAEKEKHLHENPARDVNDVKQPKKEMDFLGRVEPGEIERVLKAAHPDYYPLFVAAIWTGAREGELIALKWGNIDFAGGRISIRQTYDNYGYRDPKSEAGKRSIVMSPELAEALSQQRVILKENGKAAGADDNVFQNRDGNPLVASTVLRQFHCALERAGIRKLRFHDARHTFGALLSTMGAPPKFIQQQIGHSTLTTTLNFYGHWMPSADKEFGTKFDDFVHDLDSKDEGEPPPATD